MPLAPNPPTARRQLKDFALGGHRDHKPLPFHKSPNSLYGRALGVVHSLPAHARRGFTHLKVHRRGRAAHARPA